MLTTVDLVFGGGWVPSVEPNIRWTGEVRCDRSFVALLVGRTSGHLFWAKTEVCHPPIAITLDVHPLSYASSEVQLILTVADGWLQDLVVTVPSLPSAVSPVLPEQGEAGVLQNAFIVS